MRRGSIWVCLNYTGFDGRSRQSAKVPKCQGAKVPRCQGARECKSANVQRAATCLKRLHSSHPAPWHPGTFKHPGTPALWHLGTLIRASDLRGRDSCSGHVTQSVRTALVWKRGRGFPVPVDRHRAETPPMRPDISEQARALCNRSPRQRTCPRLAPTLGPALVHGTCPRISACELLVAFWLGSRACCDNCLDDVFTKPSPLPR